MNPMFRSAFFRLSVLVAGFALAFSSLHAGAQQDNQRRGRKYKVPPPSSRIEVSVVRDANGKPIEHAAVIFHPVEGDKDKGVMELKTNFDGKAVIDVIPIGDTVRLQIIANGFQTYGEEFNVDKDSMAMEIRMKRPGEQYSIYKQHDETAKSGTSTGDDKSGNSSKEAKPPTPPNEADNQATPSQPKPQTN
jgi:hypothetical protein